MWTINWAHKKTDAKKSEISKRKNYLIVTAAAFLIGGYDGFYGPDTGTFLLLTYTGLARMDVRTASGKVSLFCDSNAPVLTAGEFLCDIFKMSEKSFWHVFFMY